MFSEDFLDFAFTESGRLSESKQLTLKNKYNFPIQVDWTLMPVYDKATGKFVENPFKVSPKKEEIPANGTCSFHVEFAPYEPSSYFF